MKKRGIETKTKILEGPESKQPIFIGTKNIFKPKNNVQSYIFSSQKNDYI